MEKRERIKILKQLRENPIKTLEYKAKEVEEALNWAIKVCHKQASQDEAKNKK